MREKEKEMKRASVFGREAEEREREREREREEKVADQASRPGSTG